MNSNYSLRSFAKDLEMPSSNLSSVISGKQGLSKESAFKIAEKLRIKGSEKERFIDLVLASDARSKKEKVLAAARLRKRDLLDKKELQEDYFKLISEWYYYAILELITIEDFESDHSWISEQLGIGLSETDQAMDRLIRLGLVLLDGNRYQSTGAQLDTTYDIPSFYIKKHNAQILNKATNAIVDQDIEKRELSTLTIAIGSEDIDFVKKKIRDFRKNLDKEIMERTKKKGAGKVYCLAIQFFDLLKGNKDENN
jgi:uncharacterized protein (TIGR02147 family)